MNSVVSIGEFFLSSTKENVIKRCVCQKGCKKVSFSHTMVYKISAQSLVSNISLLWTNVSKENFLKTSLVTAFDGPHDTYIQVGKEES